MRVLFVFYDPSGGVETLNRQRSLALMERGIECHCLYFREGAGLQNTKQIPTFVTNDEQEIKKIVDAGNYTAIVVVSAYPYIPKFREMGYRGVIVFEVQGWSSEIQARRAFTHAQIDIITHADALLNPKTPYIAALFRELFPTVKQYAFNNCIDTRFFSHRQAAQKDFPVIAWIGRIDHNKNWREFIRIGHELAKREPKIRLWMFQDSNLAIPELKEEFNIMVHELKLEERLTTFSNVPYTHMPIYFSIIGDSGGLLCSTSLLEGAPYSILEAMSCRCPVLTTDSGGVRHSVIANKTGKYYALGNINQAVYEAAHLMKNTKLREKIIQNAENHVRSNFSPEQYCKHFVAMLNELRTLRAQK